MRTLVAAACCALLSLSQQAIAQEAATRTYSQKTLLKNWALSRCLAKVFTDTATQDDANATAGDLFHSAELERLASKFSKTSPPR
jgi:hypothetical protein